MFNYGNRDAKDIGFLKRVFSQHPSNLLATDHDHGNGIHHGRHQTCHGVSRARSRSNEYRCRFSSGPSVSVGHVNGTLFVANKDKLHFGFDGFESVENWNRGTAGITKYVLDTEIVQSLNKSLGAVVFVLSHAKIRQN